MQFALFHDLLNDFRRLGGVIKKLFNSVLSMQNLESVALMVFEKRCQDMTDRRTDMAKFFSLIKNIYALYGPTCLLPPVAYILPKLKRPFFSF